ncbi:putative F-box protein At1g23770 [Argentina anserina]|uniref:putative F-box protein At1g23770 n=1 Tax=Argentina anserina TaxID=57926 RepID=UPI0021767B55|nr:putative F-box protein At1g23770 [Potentilla anserina]
MEIDGMQTNNQAAGNLKALREVVYTTLLDSDFVPLPPLVSGKSALYTLPGIPQNGGEVTEGIAMVFHYFSPFVEAFCGRHPVVLLDETKQVKKIRNVVKMKEIALPLLVIYCAVTLARLRAPPCRLLDLPLDLKSKIMKLLPLEDIGRVSCVCKELQNLANDECDDDFWKQKEYGTNLIEFRSAVQILVWGRRSRPLEVLLC